MSTRLRRPAAGLLAAATATALLAGCGPDDVTQPDLESTLASSFARLYVRQQQLLGRPGLSPDALAVRARCDKPGAGANRGAGAWTCTVTWFGPDGTPLEADYELQAKAGGCFTAAGQPAVVGAPRLEAPDGGRFVNPVAAIDACYLPGAEARAAA
ncbi:hypothetical protein CLV35_0140 [Motilibacter peucedani]|uniref:Lipoprotein n=1 Tax=Motilibacter peucedani TaxID=598650 RepID=A0A420XV12_9ACTN|nr:hypothetical protein [Motilibacter peucedani]RKS80674.1 hypothetical protein CLV35_0140 [Motilibacter peucedani]